MMVRIQKLGALVLIGAMGACTGSIEGPPPGAGTGSGGSKPGTATGGSGPSGSGSSKGSGSGGAVSGSTGGSTANPGSGGSGADPGMTGSGGSAPAVLNLQGSPLYYRFVRLTTEQWSNSVRDLLAIAAPTAIAANFHESVSGNNHDFSNNEEVLDIDQPKWLDFQGASETLAAQVTASDAALAKIYSGTDAAGFISTFGRRAYRRPLTAAEKSTYMTLFTSGATLTRAGSAFAKGASLVIRAMLQSPYFLYRSELGTNGQPLTAYEMAAKLSLWLRNTTPNDALLDAAGGTGKLDTADGAVAMAKTMLDEPTASTVMRKFHGEFLHLDLFANLTKSGVPSFNAAIAPELTESSYRFFDKIFSSGLGVKDIFLSTTGFVGPNMAAVYGNGVTAPSAGSYTEQNLGSNRIGYFTQLPYLMYWARNGDPDSIHRGVSMNIDVLCATLGPPSNTPPMLLPKVAGETNRQNVDKTTGGCGQLCHNAMINPLGFAFEHYDGMGQYRDMEKDIAGTSLPIDSSGSYAFTDGTKSYSGAPELMQVLANGQQAHMCYAKKLAGFALQRDVIDSDMPLLTTLASTSVSSSGSVKQMMLDLVKQNTFRTRFGGAQ
jgi:Protein of unknown function (DUF1592)/Protein of unknown function (DUF1595)/Protein of unknown function (DUF1588)/Protein of unknown function (DUF1585)/Protein of unknown function (DUF1587)